MTTTACRAKNPATCRVHGTQAMRISNYTVYGKKAYEELKPVIGELVDFLHSEAGKKYFTYDQYEQIKNDLEDKKLERDITWKGYKNLYSAAASSTNPTEYEYRIKQVEEAREEALARTPEAYKQAQHFNNIVNEYGENTFKTADIGKSETKYNQTREYLNSLEAGTRIAVEYYDGSRFIATIPHHERTLMSRLGLDTKNNIINGNFNDGFSPALNLPDSNMATEYPDVKTVTVLKAKTPEGPLLPEAGTPIDLSRDLTLGRHCKVSSKHLEGIYYSEAASLDNAESSPSNHYRFIADAKISLL